MPLVPDPKSAALVLIDIQEGTLALPLAPHDRTALAANAGRLGRAFAEAGSPIVAVSVTFSADGGDRPKGAVDQPLMLPRGRLPADFAALAPEIAALPATLHITKHQWSAFHGTELDLQLRRRGISTVVLCGFATNFGVESTARDAWQHNYSVLVASDACTTVCAEMHDFALKHTLPRVSRVRSTDEIVAALG
ncbi:MAG: isochorismatase family protein [Oricola sp.]